ncbi:MAG TPA: hypothetical protein VNO26_10325 [Candidatus Limnocylindria bacterium]|nr:hypothetical protein [Candidatus Limnocylindria bacterium]
MRRLLAAVLLCASGSAASAGVLVELTDGTKVTVESHWNDGDRVHLVRGGVDMIVRRSQIKSIDENVPDPEVYRGGNAPEEGAEVAESAGETEAAGAAATAEAAAPEGVPPDPSLATLSPEELEALEAREAERLLQLQDKRFTVLHGKAVTPEQQRAVEEEIARQSRRMAQLRSAREQAITPDGMPTVPRVEQPQ